MAFPESPGIPKLASLFHVPYPQQTEVLRYDNFWNGQREGTVCIASIGNILDVFPLIPHGRLLDFHDVHK